MARWPTCQYSNPNMSFAALSSNVQRIHDQIAAILDKRIDGHNLSPSVVGAGLILKPQPPNGPMPLPPKLTNPLGDDEDTTCWIQKKGAPFAEDADKPGLEIVVDASDTTYGRVCVVDSDDLTRQVGSIIPTREANPQFKIRANYGKASFGTSGAHNWELHRNGAASLADDGSAIGTTREMFRIGTLGADSNYVAIKRTDNLLSVRLADDSNDAGVLAREAIIQVSDGEKVYVNTLNGLVLANDLGVKWSQSDGPDDTLDLDLTRSAAGKALVRDPSGGNTSPMLQLGGTDNTFPAVKRSSTRAQTKLADDSAFAGHDAGTLDLYGASTTKRSRIDPGTPSADTTSALPNRDGTIVQRPGALTDTAITRADANGDLVDSGLQDTGSLIYNNRDAFRGKNGLVLRTDSGVVDLQTVGGTSRIKINVDDSVTQAGAHTFSGTLGSSAGYAPSINTETLAGSNKTLTEASPTYQHLTPDANRDVTLPTTPTAGLLFMIRNAAATGFNLTVKDSGGSTEATLSDNEWAYFQYVSGTTWHSWGLF